MPANTRSHGKAPAPALPPEHVYHSSPTLHQVQFPSRRRIVRTYGRRSAPPGSTLRQQTLTQIDWATRDENENGEDGNDIGSAAESGSENKEMAGSAKKRGHTNLGKGPTKRRRTMGDTQLKKGEDQIPSSRLHTQTLTQMIPRMSPARRRAKFDDDAEVGDSEDDDAEVGDSDCDHDAFDLDFDSRENTHPDTGKAPWTPPKRIRPGDSTSQVPMISSPMIKRYTPPGMAKSPLAARASGKRNTPAKPQATAPEPRTPPRHIRREKSSEPIIPSEMIERYSPLGTALSPLAARVSSGNSTQPIEPSGAELATHTPTKRTLSEVSSSQSPVPEMALSMIKRYDLSGMARSPLKDKSSNLPSSTSSPKVTNLHDRPAGAVVFGSGGSSGRKRKKAEADERRGNEGETPVKRMAARITEIPDSEDDEDYDDFRDEDAVKAEDSGSEGEAGDKRQDHAVEKSSDGDEKDDEHGDDNEVEKKKEVMVEQDRSEPIPVEVGPESEANPASGACFGSGLDDEHADYETDDTEEEEGGEEHQSSFIPIAGETKANKADQTDHAARAIQANLLTSETCEAGDDDYHGDDDAEDTEEDDAGEEDRGDSVPISSQTKENKAGQSDHAASKAYGAGVGDDKHGDDEADDAVVVEDDDEEYQSDSIASETKENKAGHTTRANLASETCYEAGVETQAAMDLAFLITEREQSEATSSTRPPQTVHGWTRQAARQPPRPLETPATFESQRVPLEIIRGMDEPHRRSDVFVSVPSTQLAHIVSGAKTHEFRSYMIPCPPVVRFWIIGSATPNPVLRYMATIGGCKRPGEIPDDRGLGNARFNRGMMPGARYAYEMTQVYELNDPVPLGEMLECGWIDHLPQRTVFVGPAIVGQLLANLCCALFVDEDEELEEIKEGPEEVEEAEDPVPDTPAASKATVTATAAAAAATVTTLTTTMAGSQGTKPRGENDRAHDPADRRRRLAAAKSGEIVISSSQDSHLSTPEKRRQARDDADPSAVVPASSPPLPPPPPPVTHTPRGARAFPWARPNPNAGRGSRTPLRPIPSLSQATTASRATTTSPASVFLSPVSRRIAASAAAEEAEEDEDVGDDDEDDDGGEAFRDPESPTPRRIYARPPRSSSNLTQLPDASPVAGLGARLRSSMLPSSENLPASLAREDEREPPAPLVIWDSQDEDGDD